jgi:hypothetical protein
VSSVGDRGQHVGAEERDVVEVGEVQHLEVGALGAGFRSSSTSRPMAAARRAISASSRPTQTTSAAEVTKDAGSRSIASHAARTRARPSTNAPSSRKARFHSAA